MPRLMNQPRGAFDLSTLPRDDADLPCLPLSEWLEKALNDLSRCERDAAHYTVDMSEWHRPDLDGKHCLVCLAGSLLAWTFGLSDACEYTQHDPRFHATYQWLFFALDDLREGNIAEACGSAMLSPLIPDHVRRICEVVAAAPTEEYDMEVADYRANPAQWRKDMEGVLRQLYDLGV